MTPKIPDVHRMQVFLDAPFPATGKSDVEGYFGPPYYEWWAASQVRNDFHLKSIYSVQPSCHEKGLETDFDALAQ